MRAKLESSFLISHLLVYPLQNSIVNTALLLVLSRREGHALLLLCTILVGEDNHDVLTREVLHQFVGQPIQCILIGYGALTCGNHDEHVILAHLFGKFGQFVPVSHICVFRPDVGVVVVDVLPDQFQ